LRSHNSVDVEHFPADIDDRYICSKKCKKRPMVPATSRETQHPQSSKRFWQPAAFIDDFTRASKILVRHRLRVRLPLSNALIPDTTIMFVDVQGRVLPNDLF
jgi:hypothetical protein